MLGEGTHLPLLLVELLRDVLHSAAAARQSVARQVRCYKQVSHSAQPVCRRLYKAASGAFSLPACSLALPCPPASPALAFRSNPLLLPASSPGTPPLTVLAGIPPPPPSPSFPHTPHRPPPPSPTHLHTLAPHVYTACRCPRPHMRRPGPSYLPYLTLPSCPKRPPPLQSQSAPKEYGSAALDSLPLPAPWYTRRPGPLHFPTSHFPPPQVHRERISPEPDRLPLPAPRYTPPRAPFPSLPHSFPLPKRPTTPTPSNRTEYGSPGLDRLPLPAPPHAPPRPFLPPYLTPLPLLPPPQEPHHPRNPKAHRVWIPRA